MLLQGRLSLSGKSTKNGTYCGNPTEIRRPSTKLRTVFEIDLGISPSG